MTPFIKNTGPCVILWLVLLRYAPAFETTQLPMLEDASSTVNKTGSVTSSVNNTGFASSTLNKTGSVNSSVDNTGPASSTVNNTGSASSTVNNTGPANSTVNNTSGSFGSEPAPLYIGTLQPLSAHWWATYGRYMVDFLQWVFDDINARKDILPGYELRLQWRDTQGEAGLAARRMFELLTQGPPKLAICGVGLSDELVMAGNIAQYYNIPLMSFTAHTSNSLSREGFQSVYITNYQGESANLPFLAILEYFGWTRVSTIIFKDIMFETQMDKFHALLLENNVTLVTSAVVTDLDHAADSLKRLKQFGARIIVGAFRATQAPYIFCEAYKQGLYGPSYVWLLTGPPMYNNWLHNHFKKDPSTWVDCTRQQVGLASRGYLAVDDVYLRPDTHTVTVAGITVDEYEQQVANFSATTSDRMSRSTPYAFDAAWALALTLNKTASKLSQGVLIDTKLEDFNYSRQDIFDLNLESLEEISFQGVSGPVSFTHDGRRLGPHLITRYEIDAKSVVGFVDSDNNLTWHLSDTALFYGRPPPLDRLIHETRILPPSSAAIAIVMVINCFGISTDLAFLTFNILYRKNGHIKMSSPNINNVIVLGGFLMYIFVFVLTLDYAQWFGLYNNTLCSVRVCLACLGFTVAFGALFSKTWRVHALFRQTQIKRKVIRDSKLLSIISILVLADLVILLPWTLVSPLSKVQFEQEAEEESTQNIRVTYRHTTCSHEDEIYWFMAEYILKGLLLVFGAFLAWETRKVTIPALNDSKLIGFCIYNIAVVCALAVPVVHVVGQDKPTLTFLLVGLFVSLCTTLVLCILFIPKVRLRNQVTERRFVSSLNTQQQLTGRPTTMSMDPRDPQVQGTARAVSAGRHDLSSLSAAGGFLNTVAGQNNSLALPTNGSISSSKQNSTSCSSLADQTAANNENSTSLSGPRSKPETHVLETEVSRLTSLLSEELKAVADLKRALLTESQGRLQFHKVRKDYVISNTQKSSEVPTAHAQQEGSTTHQSTDDINMGEINYALDSSA